MHIRQLPTMHPVSVLSLTLLATAVSSQCFGGGCGFPMLPPPCFGGNCGCSGNNCVPQVTVVQVPSNNNGCSCSPCFGSQCAPACNYCPPPPPIFLGGSSCCNQNNFSCCEFRFRRHNKAAESKVDEQ